MATGLSGEPASAAVDGIVRADDDDGYVVDLKVSTADGELRRRAHGTTCREVGDAAVALVVSMLAPHVAAERMRVGSADPLAPIAPPDAAGRPWRTLRGFVRVSGAGSFGILPRWGGGPIVAGGLDIARARVELRSFVDAPQRVPVDDTTATVSFVAWSGAALGCFVPGRGTITIPLCAGPELSWVRGQADGLQLARTANRMLVNVLGSVALAYAPVSWIALRAEVGGLIVLTPGRFVIEDLGAVHRIGAGAARLGIGVEFRFGEWTPRGRQPR